MNDDNRLEESRLDADHLADIAAKLAVMQARAEAAEAALSTANECEAARLESQKNLLAYAQMATDENWEASMSGLDITIRDRIKHLCEQNVALILSDVDMTHECDSLTRELSAMRERAEKAEARNISINPWPWRNWRKK